MAREYDIGLLWLPYRCPELNEMDQLWGHAKDEVCANHQDPSIDHLVDAFIRYIQCLSAEEARRKAGFLSDDFWLSNEYQISFANLLRIPVEAPLVFSIKFSQPYSDPC